jgi:two-component system sensor histidine kinase ResE
MMLLRSVVGKLWMTIIALVAVVLVILGLFLFRFIDATFPDQVGSLQSLADNLAKEAGIHQADERYMAGINDFLKAEDAGMIVLRLQDKARPAPELPLGSKRYPVDAVMSANQLKAVYAGQRVAASFSSRTERGKEDYLLIAIPVRTMDSGQAKESLILFQSKKSVEYTQNYVKRLFAMVSFFGFLLTTFFAFFLISKINRPLIELKNAADFITRGHYDRRVPVMSSDEIGQLSNKFNLMGERLEGTIRDLNHEKDNLASVLRSMGDSVISYDVDGRIIFLNPEGERLLADWSEIRWSEPAALGQGDVQPLRKERMEPTEHSAKGTGEETADRVTGEVLGWDPTEEQEENPAEEPFEAGFGTGEKQYAGGMYRLIPEPLQQMFRSVISDTREISTKLHVRDRVWSIVMAPLYSQDMVRGVVAVLRDVTEEFRLEKLRKDFVANVSHELRTPLSMLQGYSEALVDDIAATPGERKELAQIIHDETLRMGRLVRDLLDLARMETGNMEFHFRQMDTASFLKRIHRKFSVYCKEQGIQLDLLLDKEIPVMERADEDRLEQVMTNLLDNAVRHTPAGTAIRITASPAVMRGKKAVTMEVQDEGQGIPADDLPYIFERFYKADKARTRGTSGGTGLGLAIAKNIVDAHKGTIQVKSKVGEWTSFILTFPVS